MKDHSGGGEIGKVGIVWSVCDYLDTCDVY